MGEQAASVSGPGPLQALAAEFERRFGRPASVAVRAPGRVNLIGEHTDYNEGLVLPCAIDRDTIVLAAPRSDGQVRVFSTELAEEARFDAGAPVRAGAWWDYVQAPLFALAEAGHAPAGADLGIVSSVPPGSGLSSSAALGVAVTTAFDRLGGLGLSPLEVATLAHRGENGFVGVGCGILDQFASALGRRDHALFIDCRDRKVEPVPLGEGRLAILVVQSGVERALAAGAYDRRVAECRAAVSAAREAGIAPGARSLRDLASGTLPALESALDELPFRRARHVISENARVLATRTALAEGNLVRVGELLREGMRSLRDDYAVSTPELDTLCELGDAHVACFGSRLTGAGFGGSTIHLVEPGRASEVADHIADGFAARFGRRPPTHLARPTDGAGDLPTPLAGISGDGGLEV